MSKTKTKIHTLEDMKATEEVENEDVIKILSLELEKYSNQIVELKNDLKSEKHFNVKLEETLEELTNKYNDVLMKLNDINKSKDIATKTNKDVKEMVLQKLREDTKKELLLTNEKLQEITDKRFDSLKQRIKLVI